MLPAVSIIRTEGQWLLPGYADLSHIRAKAKTSAVIRVHWRLSAVKK